MRASLRAFAEQIFREEFKVIEDQIIKKQMTITFSKELKQVVQISNSFLSKVSKPAAEALRIIQEKNWDITEISYGEKTQVFSRSSVKHLRCRKTLKTSREPVTDCKTISQNPKSGRAKQQLIRLTWSLLRKTFDSDHPSDSGHVAGILQRCVKC